jgi:hypothetical protein
VSPLPYYPFSTKTGYFYWPTISRVSRANSSLPKLAAVRSTS